MNSRRAAFEILKNIIYNKEYSNIAFKYYMKKYNMDTIDKNFIKELVFGTLERKFTLDFIINFLAKKGIKKIDFNVILILEMGLYQIIYMNKVPEYAAINESVILAKDIKGNYVSKFVNAILRNYIRNNGKILYPQKDILSYLCIKYSFPRWIVKRLLKDYDITNTKKILESLNEKPKIAYRLNKLKIDKINFEKLLETHNINYVKGYYNDDAYYLDIKDVENNFLYLNGLIQIQDEGSMLISKVLSPMPGDHIVDVCSAPGGKTTHISELMNNKGLVYAFDIHKHRLKLVENNCKRLGINIVKTVLFDSTKINHELIDEADKILVDVPCTGIGIIRKKPDIKLKNYTKDNINTINKVQYEILSASSKYVKNGGFIVYSTCTIGRAENYSIIYKFLMNNKNFKITNISTYLPDSLKRFVDENGCIQLLPHLSKTDGFFICKMQRND